MHEFKKKDSHAIKKEEKRKFSSLSFILFYKQKQEKMVTTRKGSAAAAAASSADHRALYKRTSISRTPDELKQRRVAIDESLRKKHREQLITAKRYRNLTRQEEFESAGEDEPVTEKNEDDGKL